MRTIKFRAWDKAKKEFVKLFHITQDGEVKVWDGSGWGENQYYTEYGIELMQYTGLHDKNGVEIYEGDIIKFNPMISQNLGEYLEKIYPVSYNENSGSFGIYEGKLSLYLFGLMKNIEVIGNIYQNPELLKGTDA